VPAQAQSDTEFWFGAPDLQTVHGDRPILLRIASGDLPANVTISIPANSSFIPLSFPLAANQSASIDLTPYIDLIENGTPNTAMKKGLLVQSTAGVSVYYDINNNFNGDLYALKGRNALGTDFTVPMQMDFNNRASTPTVTYTADIIILATQDGTQVDVTARSPFTGQPAAFTIALQRGETYVISSASSTGTFKPGGTIIRSNKPITVSTKDDSIGLPGQGCADTGGDQLIPDFMTGREYIITRGYLAISPDTYYVFATQDNTTVSVDGTVVATLARRGDFYRGQLSAISCYVQTDKPAQVYHITGIGCEVGGAVIPAIKCTGSSQVNITRASATQNFYLNVLSPTNITDQFSLNGGNTLIGPAQFLPVPGTGGNWSVARILVPPTVAGTNEAVIVENTAGKFHVGVIQGTQNTTTRFGYFSDFSPNRTSFSDPARPSLQISDSVIFCYKSATSLRAENILAATYAWTGPNGYTSSDTTLRIPVFTVRDTGLYTITTAVPGCGVASRSVRLLIDQPVADFSLSTNGCETDSVRFTNLAAGMNRALWDFGPRGTMDTTSPFQPRIRFGQPGTHTVRLRVRSPLGCLSDDTARSFILSSVPQARYLTPTVTCVNRTLTFTDASTIVQGTIVKWRWDLADGGGFREYTGPTPQSSSYATWGTKDVRLVVESQTGCVSDTFRAAGFTVTPYPRPGFIVPEVCLDDASARFTDTTKSPDGYSAFTYRWEFNAGTTPVSPGPVFTPGNTTEKNPAVKYRKADLYYVKLVVDSRGCTDSITQPFKVNGSNPVPEFDILRPDTLCSNDSVRIRNLSMVDFDNVTRLEIFWDAGDATRKTTDEDPFVGKVYAWRYPDFQTPASKTFSITLRAFSGEAFSCSRTITKTVTVLASPKVSFDSIPGICLNAPARQITQTGFDANVPGVGVFAGPGVGASGLLDPAQAGVGLHSIQYRLVSQQGCRDSLTRSIRVWPLPVARFRAADTLCERNSIPFTDLSAPTTGAITRWVWNFGDGTRPDTLPTVGIHRHLFANWNDFRVRLTVISEYGCVSIPFDSTVRVRPLPVPAFTLPQVCLPVAEAVFTNGTTIADTSDGPLSFRWDFGVAQSGATTRDGRHTYYAKGSHPVTLYATSRPGCRDSLTRTFADIFDRPLARFSADDSACTGIEVRLRDSSVAGYGSVTQWNWNLGDGDIAGSRNLQHPYASEGRYRISLFVRTSIGCISDTAVKSVDVYAYPKVDAGPDLLVLDDGQKRMGSSASGTIVSYRWSPPDFLNDTTVLAPTIVRPQDDRTYRLTVTGRGACVSQDEMRMTVLRLPNPPNTFTPNGDGVNDVWDVRYLDQYPGCLVEVYAPTGTLLFRSVGYDRPWDGTHRGMPQPAGTYYYVIDPRNGRKRMAGYVTIIR
jgi:gliding motility-associated-like protein